MIEVDNQITQPLQETGIICLRFSSAKEEIIFFYLESDKRILEDFRVGAGVPAWRALHKWSISSSFTLYFVSKFLYCCVRPVHHNRHIRPCCSRNRIALSAAPRLCGLDQQHKPARQSPVTLLTAGKWSHCRGRQLPLRWADFGWLPYLHSDSFSLLLHNRAEAGNKMRKLMGWYKDRDIPCQLPSKAKQTRLKEK